MNDQSDPQKINVINEVATPTVTEPPLKTLCTSWLPEFPDRIFIRIARGGRTVQAELIAVIGELGPSRVPQTIVPIVLSTAKTVCSKSDKFILRTGVRIAVTRLASRYDKDFRGLIWEAAKSCLNFGEKNLDVHKLYARKENGDGHEG